MIEKAVMCPFNSQHIMMESALQKHIIRCMVNYPNYLVCPYNALHRLKNKELLTKHMLECPSKMMMSSICYNQSFNKLVESSDVPYHVDNVRKFNLAEEDWDAELS